MTLTHSVSSNIAGVRRQKSLMTRSTTTHDGNTLALACQQVTQSTRSHITD